MGVFTWFNCDVPEGMETTQVWGVCFTKDGRIMLKYEYVNGKRVYSLPGGTPEVYDKDRVATLRREFVEEANTTLEDDVYLVGHQVVNIGDGTPPFAQVRMTALIKEIGEKLPDPDTGETFGRLLTTPERAIELLNYGKEGEKMIIQAMKVAKDKLKIKTVLDEEKEI